MEAATDWPWEMEVEEKEEQKVEERQTGGSRCGDSSRGGGSRDGCRRLDATETEAVADWRQQWRTVTGGGGSSSLRLEATMGVATNCMRAKVGGNSRLELEVEAATATDWRQQWR